MKIVALVVSLSLLSAVNSHAYPLDGEARTGARRIKGNANAQASEFMRKLPPGATLTVDEVKLHLDGVAEAWDLGAKDPELQAAVDGIFASRDPSYGLAVIDITDPERITWAGRNEDMTQYPGSVGKVLCLTALMDGLRRAFPDTAERERILRETIIESSAWSAGDSHKVPFLDEESGFNKWRPIGPADKFTLGAWVDHMMSASANSAGSMVWKEAMLLRQFGKEYPVSREREEAFFRETSKANLAALSLKIINEPLAAAGLDLKALRQGTFWTKSGQARVPGTSSFGSPRELARFLLRIEQGRIVDEWSSLEIKRYMYLTKKRFRYSYAPELSDAAVYFKSGSMYSCAPEAGFACGKFKGNVKNFMNSIAIIESPARPIEGVKPKRYIVALLSNVLRVNSAWDHARVGAAIEEAVRTRTPAVVKESGTDSAIKDAGAGD